MSVFHYKGILIKKNGNEAFYQYFSDYVMQKDISGEFKFSLIDWKPKITFKADNKGRLVVYIDERCVEALTHKIKKYSEQNGKLPEEIYWIA